MFCLRKCQSYYYQIAHSNPLFERVAYPRIPKGEHLDRCIAGYIIGRSTLNQNVGGVNVKSRSQAAYWTLLFKEKKNLSGIGIKNDAVCRHIREEKGIFLWFTIREPDEIARATIDCVIDTIFIFLLIFQPDKVFYFYIYSIHNK